MFTSSEFPESPEIVLIFQGRSGSTEKVRTFLSQFERKIQIFEIFRISSVEGIEKVLNFSVEEVLNFLGMY